MDLIAVARGIRVLPSLDFDDHSPISNGWLVKTTWHNKTHLTMLSMNNINMGNVYSITNGSPLLMAEPVLPDLPPVCVCVCVCLSNDTLSRNPALSYQLTILQLWNHPVRIVGYNRKVSVCFRRINQSDHNLVKKRRGRCSDSWSAGHEGEICMF